MKSVLIIGGNGYIGSRIIHDLTSFNMESIDLCWYGKDLGYSNQIDYNSLTRTYLSKFNTIILLAGHSSVKMCEGNLLSSWNNNVSNFINLISKLDRDQCLIYASSGSVYGITPVPLTEDTLLDFKPINNYDLSKYSLDLNAMSLINQGYNITGLRFGTVNGWSPNVRGELMINSMTRGAIDNNRISINNAHIRRPILGINDLSRAVHSIIDDPKPGIYNLSSFCDSVEGISACIGQKLGIEIQRTPDTSNAYDFIMGVDKFKQIYNFEFKESTESIVDELISRSGATYSNRNQCKNYE